MGNKEKSQTEQFNPYKNFPTSDGKERSDYFLKISEAVMVKLNSLEEYEELATCDDDVLVLLNDILEQCNTVYTVPPAFMRYATSKLQVRGVSGSIGFVDHALEGGIKKGGYDINSVPLIPIMEYKLVPTGFITWFDPTKNRKQRMQDRLKHDDYNCLRRKRKKERDRAKRAKKKGEEINE